MHYLNTSYAPSSGTINLLLSPSDIDNSWILNTSDTYHLCHSKDMFTHLIVIKPIIVRLPNRNVIQANYVGNDFFNIDFYLMDVLYIPNFCTNLICVPKLTRHLQCQIVFYSHQCFIQGIHTLRRIGAAKLLHGLYLLVYPILDTRLNNVSNINSVTINNSYLWHQRLGHPCNDTIFHINKKFPIPTSLKPPPLMMLVYMLNKDDFLLPHSTTNFENPFDLIHVDIWGPISTPFMQGHRYFLTVVDDFSRFCWIYLTRHKSETVLLVQSFITFVKKQFQTSVKILSFDNGLELTLKDLYLNQGINHQTSCVDRPQQNAIMERKHQHLLGVTCALLFQSHFPKKLGSCSFSC